MGDSLVDKKVLLTEKEKEWLKSHPNIILVYTDIFEPEVILKSDGSYEGILVDLLDEINLRLGTRIGLDILPVPEVLDKAGKNKIDGILSIHPEYAKKLGMVVTRGHITNYPAIFALKNNILKHPTELANKKVAIVKGVYHSEQIFKKFGAGSTLLEVNDSSEGFSLLQKKEVDFFIAATFNSYLFAKYQFLNLTTQYVFYDIPMHSGIAVRSDRPMLVSILNKAIDSFSEKELQAFSEKWLPQLPGRRQIQLSTEEQEWLKKHPTLHFGFMKGYEPYLVIDEKQNQSGILADVSRELSRLMGVDIVIDVSKNIPELIKKSEKKEIDVVYTIAPTRADKMGLLKSDVILKSYTALYAREGLDVKTPEDLAGRTITLPEDAAYAKQVVDPYREKVTKLINVHSPLDGLKMVNSKKADIFVGTSTHNYLIHKYRLFGVYQAYVETGQDTEFVMGIRNDWPLLQSILNKALAALPERGVETIVAKWVGSTINQMPYRAKEEIKLTAREKSWLAEDHTVKVRFIDFPPFLMPGKNGNPHGISVDYLNLISRQTGIKFNYKETTDPFSKALEGLQKSQGPDLITSMMKTPEREKSILFSKEYFRSPYVIFVHKGSKRFIGEIQDLAGQKLALVNGTALLQNIKKAFPGLDLVLSENDETAIKAVVTGKAHAYIGNLTLASHIILAEGLSNLKIAAPTPFGDHTLHMGARNDWPELISIIDKILDNVSPEEHLKIKNKYIAIQYENAKAAAIIKWIIIVSIGAVFILFLFFFWNLSLRKKVSERTLELTGTNKALETEIGERKLTEKALRKSEQRFRATFDQAAVGISHVAPGGNFLRINQKFCDIVGYSKQEMLKLTFQEITHPEDLNADLALVWQLLDGKMDTYSIEKRYQQKSDAYTWILLTVSLVRNKTGEPKWFVAVAQDINTRKNNEKKIKKYQIRLKALATQLTLVEEKERRRIAGELHDHIGQTLALSRIQIARAKKHANSDTQTAILDELSQSLLSTIQATKNLVFDLSSPFLNELGLSAAVANWLKEQIFEKYNIRTRFVDEIEHMPLNYNVEMILFRNIRELLTNVIKHAQAEQVTITLQGTKKEYQIIIQDDGIGFEPEETANHKNNGFGLFSIRERMVDFGGSMEIFSTPGNGCRTILSIPIWKNTKDKGQ